MWPCDVGSRLGWRCQVPRRAGRVVGVRRLRAERSGRGGFAAEWPESADPVQTWQPSSDFLRSSTAAANWSREVELSVARSMELRRT